MRETRSALGDSPRPHRKLLARGARLAAGLSYYGVQTAQHMHAHPSAQLSFLVLGELHERHQRTEFEPSSGWLGFKPAGCMHADHFGADGALLLTIEGADLDRLARAPGWAPQVRDPAPAALIRLAADCGTSGLAADAIEDLVATAVPGRATGTAPPRALELARQQLRDEPATCRIDALAERSGFDRTHFAHLFRRHFGLPPSLYRARSMTAKATHALLTSPAGIADAAFAAGFADHSHFTRTLRRFTGLSPHQLRTALA